MITAYFAFVNWFFLSRFRNWMKSFLFGICFTSHSFWAISYGTAGWWGWGWSVNRYSIKFRPLFRIRYKIYSYDKTPLNDKLPNSSDKIDNFQALRLNVVLLIAGFHFPLKSGPVPLNIDVCSQKNTAFYIYLIFDKTLKFDIHQKICYYSLIDEKKTHLWLMDIGAAAPPDLLYLRSQRTVK